MKKMKFERKQARGERKAAPPEPLADDGIMPPPGGPIEVKAAPVEEALKPQIAEPTPVASTPRQPKPQLAPAEQIGSYVRALDWGRVRSTARKAVASGAMDEAAVDAAIDAALPSAEELQGMPLHHVMAIASAATDEKRAEYAPILQMHAEHAKSLPPEEQGQVKDHLALLGMLQQEPQQEMTV